MVMRVCLEALRKLACTFDGLKSIVMCSSMQVHLLYIVRLLMHCKYYFS